MDLITADVTDCPAVAAGDTVTLLGSEGGCVMDAVEMARRAGTIPYVILCGIGRRVARLHC
jgi:alanine racemase